MLIIINVISVAYGRSCFHHNSGTSDKIPNSNHGDIRKKSIASTNSQILKPFNSISELFFGDLIKFSNIFPYHHDIFTQPFFNNYHKYNPYFFTSKRLCPSSKVYENEEQYQIAIEIPHTSVEDIDIEISGHADDRNLKVSWVQDNIYNSYIESYPCSHTFSLGRNANLQSESNGILSYYEDGILYIDIKKSHIQPTVKVPISNLSDNNKDIDNNSMIDMSFDRAKESENDQIHGIDSSPIDMKKSELEMMNLAITQDEDGDDVIDLDVLQNINTDNTKYGNDNTEEQKISNNEKIEKPVLTNAEENERLSNSEQQQQINTADLLSVLNEMMKIHNISMKPLEIRNAQ